MIALARVRASAVAAFVVLALARWGESAALAQSPEVSQALAETLFQDAKKLMANGDYAHACPKLDESLRLDPGNGTRLALALCYEGDGKTAAAWSLFTLGAAEARRENRADREALAREHIASLEPALSRLTIDVDPSLARAPGVVVRQDGLPIAAATWGTAMPVDPGEHTLDVSAPGKVPWRGTVRIDERGATKSIRLPALADVSVSPASLPTEPPASAEPANGGAQRRTGGLVVGAVGVVALGSFAVFGVSGASDYRGLQRSCGPHCDSDQVAPVRTKLLAADVSLAVGVTALATAALLIFWPSRKGDSPASPAVGIAVQPGAEGIRGAIVGRF